MDGLSDDLLAYGQVESVSDGVAFIRTQRESGCGGCKAEQTCGTSTLARLFSMGTQPLLRLPNAIHAKPGDQVELSLAGHSLIKQAFMAYGMPLLGLFAGALLALWLVPQGGDASTILGSLSGLVFAWWWVRHYHHPEEPKLIRIVVNKSCVTGEESRL